MSSLSSMMTMLEVAVKSTTDENHDLLDYELQNLENSLETDYPDVSDIIKQVRMILDQLVTK